MKRLAGLAFDAIRTVALAIGIAADAAMDIFTDDEEHTS